MYTWWGMMKLTITEDQNMITVDHSWYPMRNWHNSAIGELFTQSLLNDIVCCSINGGCCLIKNENTRLFK